MEIPAPRPPSLSSPAADVLDAGRGSVGPSCPTMEHAARGERAPTPKHNCHHVMPSRCRSESPPIRRRSAAGSSYAGGPAHAREGRGGRQARPQPGAGDKSGGRWRPAANNKITASADRSPGWQQRQRRLSLQPCHPRAHPVLIAESTDS